MPKILIVEDDFDIQELLENFLQENAYETPYLIITNLI